MATQDQIITAVSQELHTLLVPPEKVRIDTLQGRVAVITCASELMGKIAVHFGMMVTLPEKHLSVVYQGWRVYLDRDQDSRSL